MDDGEETTQEEDRQSQWMGRDIITKTGVTKVVNLAQGWGDLEMEIGVKTGFTVREYYRVWNAQSRRILIWDFFGRFADDGKDITPNMDGNVENDEVHMEDNPGNMEMSNEEVEQANHSLTIHSGEKPNLSRSSN